MYRVIIVDDEPVVRRGLRETIEWDSLGLEVAGEAADGIEALKLIRETRPEILITDIRMPDMDGLQLIREVRKLDFSVKITILSGYSDYQYLKDAIRLGVDNYLLKPIDNDELISNLKNAVSEIEKEAVTNLQIRQGTDLLRSNTLRRLTTGHISPEELKEKAEFLRIPLDAGRYLCAVCSASRQIPADSREQFFREILAGESGGQRMAFLDGDGNLALLFSGASAERSPAGRELEALADKAAREYEIPLTIGAGRTAENPEQIRDSFESAKEALEYGAFLKNGGIVWSDEVPETTQAEQIPDRLDYELVKEHIRHGEQEALKNYLEDALDAAAAAPGVTHRQIRNLIMHIAVRTTECFRTIYGSMNAFREPADFDYARLFTLRSYSDMRDWLFRLCDELFAANRMLLGRGTSIVGMAVDYIAEHYREGITLRRVAENCHVNTSYLGQIFRKETGSAFTDYVNALRIQEARRLLADPTLKVYEVAERVGFTDYHYFLKIFKKVTGKSPTDVRN